MTRSSERLRALQRANYSCQAPEYPGGPRCMAPAGMVDRPTGLVACHAHLSATSSR